MRFLAFHLGRIFIGVPSHLVVGCRDGTTAFRREFRRTWSQRFRASERSEYERQRKRWSG